MGQTKTILNGTTTLLAADLTNDSPREDLYLLCDSTLGAIIINLPSIATLPFINPRIFITDIAGQAGTNSITVNPDAGDTLNGATAPIIINSNGGAAKVECSSQANWIGGEALDSGAGITTVVAAANQASFAAPPLSTAPLGKTVAIQNYNGTADAATFQRIAVATGDFNDWIVTATENKASTGAIGGKPA